MFFVEANDHHMYHCAACFAQSCHCPSTKLERCIPFMACGWSIWSDTISCLKDVADRKIPSEASWSTVAANWQLPSELGSKRVLKPSDPKDSNLIPWVMGCNNCMRWCFLALCSERCFSRSLVILVTSHTANHLICWCPGLPSIRNLTLYFDRSAFLLTTIPGIIAYRFENLGPVLTLTNTLSCKL